MTSPPSDPLPAALPFVHGRILLRRLAASDLPDFQAYRTDLEVARWQGWTATGDLAARWFLEQNAECPLFVPGEWFQLGIALATAQAPGTLIGDIGLCRGAEDSGEAEIGFSLHRLWQGRGLATEAVRAACALAHDHAGVRRLRAVVDTRNTASIRLLERLGFKLDRTEPAIFRGEPCNEHHFACEWPPT